MQYEKHLNKKTACIPQSSVIDMLHDIDVLKNVIRNRERQESSECTYKWILHKLQEKNNELQKQATITTKQFQATITQLNAKIANYHTDLETLTRDNQNQKFLLDELIHGNNLPYWKEINIICSTMTANSKQAIKRAIAHINDKSEIIKLFESKFTQYTINTLNIDNKAFKLVLNLTKQNTECKICFEHAVMERQKCKTCKAVQICKDCEEKQVRFFKRCPFCNTSYHI
jgi:septal ring factor EnvC (AmiA/AmiB activator)